jgi:polyhydroxyalkanoate synthase
VPDPLALACPAVEFVSRTDRIVPAATAAGLADRRDLAAGHVGMVVGGGARTVLWEPLAAWLTAVK